MANATDDRVQLAIGHNNAAGLEALHELAAGLFENYVAFGGVLTEWHSGQQEVYDGDGTLQYVGRPWVVLKLFNLSTAEFDELSAYEGNVTAHLFNKRTSTWDDFNGKLMLPERDRVWGDDEWDEVSVLIRSLVEI